MGTAAPSSRFTSGVKFSSRKVHHTYIRGPIKGKLPLIISIGIKFEKKVANACPYQIHCILDKIAILY